MIDLKALRALCDAATQGDKSFVSVTALQWKILNEIKCNVAERSPKYASDIECWIYAVSDSLDSKANARFIAATNPQTVRALIDEIERLRNDKQYLTSALETTLYALKQVAPVQYRETIEAIEQALKGTDDE